MATIRISNSSIAVVLQNAYLHSAARFSSYEVTMFVDKDTKVVLLPKDETNFQIASLIFGSSEKQILFSDEKVYELRLISGQTSFSSRPEPKLSNGEAVKSLIIESTGPEEEGAVLSNPEIVNVSNFNLIYFVLRIMWEQKSIDNSRYHTTEDILDQFNAYIKPQQLIFGIKKHLVEAIEHVCDTIEEAGDSFYKFSPSKGNSFIEKKVEGLSNLLHSSPDFSLTEFIKSKLNAYEEAPSDMLELQIKKYAVEFIFGSYLSAEMKTEFILKSSLDFSKLENYFKEQEEKQKTLAMVESNMASIVQTTTAAKSVTAKKGKATKTTKKVVKKVAVGKGALDGFFGKK